MREVPRIFTAEEYRFWSALKLWDFFWKGRVAKHVHKDTCSQCSRRKYCARLRVNPYTIHAVIAGDTCPDFSTIWYVILGGGVYARV